MRRFFWFVTSHPRLVLCVAAVAALMLGVCALGLTRDTSPDAFIPPGHRAMELKRQVEDSFGLVEPIAVAVIRDAPEGIFNRQSLSLIERLTRAIQQLPQVQPGDVLSLATESGVYFEDGEPGFERLMKNVPQRPEEVEALRSDVLGYELYRGTLVAKDGSAACILIRPRDPRQADQVYRSLRVLLETFPTHDEQLVVAGEAAVRAHMGTAVSDDALRMNFICPVVMGVLIVLAYRTLRGTVLPLCVIGGASLWALGLMACYGVPVYIVTNGIFVIIMAVGVADAMHLLGQYYEEQLRPDGRSVQQVVVDASMALWRPVLITSLTDVAGFFSLYLVGIMPPIRYFGLFTCVGVLAALVYSYTVVPAGLAVLPLRSCKAFTQSDGALGRAGAVGPIGAALGRIGTFALRRSGAVLVVGAVLIGVAAWGATGMIVNDSRILAFKDHHPIVRATRAINDRFDGTSHLNIIVTAAEKGALVQPESLRRIEQLEAYTETLPYVGGTHSLVGWVKRAHQKMHAEDPAYYAIPTDPAETRYYLDVLGGATSPMARLLREVVDPTFTQADLIVRMRSGQFVHQRRVVESLQAYLDEHFRDGPLRAQLAGRVNLDYHWVQLVYRSHVRSVLFSAGCVLLLTGSMFRSVVAGLLCTLTVGVAVLANYAIMGIAGIPLGVGTSMFASIAIGAGVDFPIHVIDRLRSGFRDSEANAADVFRDTFAFTGRALFFTGLVVAVGFLLLCVSEFRTLVRFGLLIGTGMLVSFLVSITLLPALLAALRPRFIWGNAARRPRLGWIRRRIFGISPEEATFARRGFRPAEPHVQQRLECFGQTFVRGYLEALSVTEPQALAARLSAVDIELRGFAFEGAAMGLALLDYVTPGPQRRWQAFLAGPGTDHAYMVHVGAGWAAARIPWARLNIERRLRSMDPLLRWLVVDGYGFHQGYFHWPQFIRDRATPRRLSSYARRVFDQGLGRSLWFVEGADVSRVVAAISAFPSSRHGDLYSGVGLACAYAGGVDRVAIERLRSAAEHFGTHLAQGAAFAAKARQRAGNLQAHTELACEVLCGMPAAAAAAVTDETLADLPADDRQPAFEHWRRRIQKRMGRGERSG